MSDLNVELVKKELRNLNLIRTLLFLFTFIIIAVLIYCIRFNPPWVDIFATFFVFYFIVFLYCHISYCDYLIETAYILIARNFGYESQKKMEEYANEEEYKAAVEKDELEKKIFSGIVFKLGLFMRLWNIDYNDYLLSGTKDNYKFNIKDFELRFTRKHIDARYKLLTIDNPFPINCNIIIRKNRLVKWNLINRLKPMKIENKEFEKYYETYTNNFEEAKSLLNTDFILALLRYKKMYGRQIEVIITPKKIFLLDQITVRDLWFNQNWKWNIFVSPKKQFNKIWANINNLFDILPVISLLDKKE